MSSKGSLQNMFGSQVDLNKVSEYQVNSRLHTHCSLQSVASSTTVGPSQQYTAYEIQSHDVVTCGSSLMQLHWHGLAAGKVAIKQKTFVKPKRKVKKEFDTAVQKSVIRPCPLATAKGSGLQGHGTNTHAHTHIHVQGNVNHGQVPSEAERCCFVVVMRSASRTQVGGSVAEVLMLSNSETNSPKYGPEANVLSQPHKTSALGNTIFR